MGDGARLVPFDHTYVLYEALDVFALPAVFFTLTPIFLMVFYLLWFLLTREIQPVLVVVGHCGNELANHIAKRVWKQLRPALHAGFGSNDLHDFLFNSLQYGMPSAHLQFMGYFAAVWGLHVWTQWPGLLRAQRGALVALLAGLCVAVGGSRVHLHYHTVEQVVVGALLGWCLGVVWFAVVTMLRVYGVVRWVLLWRVVSMWYVKDLVWECPRGFREEWEEYQQRLAAGSKKTE